jgi:hypothetical protein
LLASLLRSGALPAQPEGERPGARTERFHGNRRRLLSGNPDDFPAKRQHRKSPVSRAFSVAGL